MVFEGKQLTYAELNRRANQLAHNLQALGVGPESLVGCMRGALVGNGGGAAGHTEGRGAYVPLDPSYPLARLAFMLADAGLPVLLTSEALADELPAQSDAAAAAGCRLGD